MAVGQARLTTWSGNTEAGDRFPKRTYTETWQVICTTPLHTPVDIMGAAGLPRLFQSFPGDSVAYVKSISPRLESKDGTNWRVEVSYETPADNDKSKDEQSEQDKSPLDEPPEVSGSTTTISEPYEQDIDAKPCINTAGDKFVPTPEREIDLFTLTITRNEAAPFDMKKVEDYNNTVNSDTFFGHAAGKWKMRISGFSGQQTTLNGEPFKFVKVIYEFQYRDKWDQHILNVGFRYKDSGTIKNARDDQGTAVSELILLHESGNKLEIDATPRFVKFKPYKSTAFGPLGLE